MIRTRKSGPIPEYTIPMLGQITATLSTTESSMRIEEVFFSVAITMPFDAEGTELMRGPLPNE